MLLALLFFCVCAVAPLVASAEEVVENDLIELSNDDYKNYITDSLRPSFFSEFFNDMTASASDALITDKNYTSTNAPKPSGAGSAGSSITSAIRDLGIEIVKKIINDSTINQQRNGFQIPEYRQQMGKLRNVYNSGLVEIITCTITTYETPEIGNLGEPTGKYLNHCILSLIRQTDNYYTTTVICDSGSENFCNSYTGTGNFSMSSYSMYANIYPVRFFDYEAQQTVLNHQMLMTGSSYNSVTFSNLEISDEITSSTLRTNLYFGDFQKQGISEISSGNQYRTLSYILGSSFVYSSTSNNASSSLGVAFTSFNTITNNYQDYSQKKEINETLEQKQAITYLSEINSNTVINESNIENYNYLTIEGDRLTTNSNFNSWWSSSVSEEINYNITNNYANYWYIGDPDPTEPPSTIPTQPPTEPPVTIPTQPPVTVPTESAVPKYTLDMTAVSSDMEELKKQSTSIELGKSFWVIRLLDKFLTDLNLMPLFLFLFLLSVLGVLLWK